MFTNDGRLVCAHDGKDGIWAYGYSFKNAPSEDEFLGEDFLDVLKSMSMDDVAGFMRENEDFFIL